MFILKHFSVLDTVLGFQVMDLFHGNISCFQNLCKLLNLMHTNCYCVKKLFPFLSEPLQM
jgi:hypothetical protein